MLRLDPISDREEYATLASLLASGSPLTMEALTGSELPEAGRLGLRIRNLGVDRYSVWAPGETGSVLDAVHIRASAVLSLTWARCPRARSRPWSPRRCSATCGVGAKSAARS